MLYGGALGRLAHAAELASERFLTRFDVLNVLLGLLVVLKPLKRGIVLPRVHVLNVVPYDSLIRAFLWPKLVQKVVFFLIAESFKTIFEVLFNDVTANLEFLLQLSVFPLLSRVLEAFKRPKTQISKNRSKV